jgi:hypothetical protein
VWISRALVGSGPLSSLGFGDASDTVLSRGMQLNVRSEHFYCAWFSIRESCLCQNLDQFSVQMVESVNNNSSGCLALCGVRMLTAGICTEMASLLCLVQQL